MKQLNSPSEFIKLLNKYKEYEIWLNPLASTASLIVKQASKLDVYVLSIPNKKDADEFSNLLVKHRYDFPYVLNWLNKFEEVST